MAYSPDDIDRRIIALLIEVGRMPSAAITRRIGTISERAVRYRIARLIDRGIIRVGAVVNPKALGLEVTGDILIEVAPGRLHDVAAQLVEFDNVSYVAGSVGAGDLSVQVYARDAQELMRFVNEVIGTIPGVVRTRSAIVPWKLKDAFQWRVPLEADRATDEGRLIGTQS